MVQPRNRPAPLYAIGPAGRIAFHDTGGSGPPLVLIHGINMASGVWDDLIAELAVFRCVAVDLRGHGASAHDGPFGVGDYVDDIVAVIDELALDRVALVGVSLGGMIACALAQRTPERVSSVVAFGSALRGTHPDLEAGMRRLHEVGVPAYFATSLANNSLPEDARADVIERAVALAVTGRENDPAVVEQITRAGFATDLTGLLTACTVPVMVISGDHDTTCDPEAGQEFARVVDGEWRLVPGGHVLPLERPNECARIVAEFVARADRADRRM